MSLRIAIASDHAGVEFKAKLLEKLLSLGYSCENMGTDTADSVDYPVYADRVCKKVLSGEADFGILICGTGIGMSIAANKHRGIRAALCSDTASADLTRRHNNANVLCMGARIIPYETAEAVTEAFLSGVFEGGRHQRRIDMLE